MPIAIAILLAIALAGCAETTIWDTEIIFPPIEIPLVGPPEDVNV